MMTVFVNIASSVFCFLVDNPESGKWNNIH